MDRPGRDDRRAEVDALVPAVRAPSLPRARPREPGLAWQDGHARGLEECRHALAFLLDDRVLPAHATVVRSNFGSVAVTPISAPSARIAW